MIFFSEIRHSDSFHAAFHQMSTEGFVCLLMYLLESGGKSEFEFMGYQRWDEF